MCLGKYTIGEVRWTVGYVTQARLGMCSYHMGNSRTVCVCVCVCVCPWDRREGTLELFFCVITPRASTNGSGSVGVSDARTLKQKKRKERANLIYAMFLDVCMYVCMFVCVYVRINLLQDLLTLLVGSRFPELSLSHHQHHHHLNPVLFFFFAF
ncbi:hypothetical protein F4775DRAFT_514175 [Biscogniauxia sp. FL1348]|nr:hypothetical protein F4775DRAFT_95026 [Biscogniauxia sp. FL1348]KAI0600942.1 hypothetical protein F4775DRAFT_514175 [Biscogniauxia sp. FL1348]